MSINGDDVKVNFKETQIPTTILFSFFFMKKYRKYHNTEKNNYKTLMTAKIVNNKMHRKIQNLKISHWNDQNT
jgi:hypothetical protein